MQEDTAESPEGAIRIDAGQLRSHELVALDPQGRSDFNLMQNFRAAQFRLHYYAFDILMPKGRSVVGLPLSERRVLLETVLPRDSQVSQSAVVPNLPDSLRFVQLHGLEGVEQASH